MFKVNQKRPRLLREEISFLMNWNNPQRGDLVQVSVLGGWSLWAPDRTSLQRSSWCWVAASLNWWGVFPQCRETWQSSPWESTKSATASSSHWKKGQDLQKWYRILGKKKKRQAGRKEGQWRERRRGCRGEGGKGGSSAFWIPSIERAHGPNIQIFEGSVAIGTSDQSGYREPKKIIRSLEILYLPTGMWQNCTWETQNRTRQKSMVSA